MRNTSRAREPAAWAAARRWTSRFDLTTHAYWSPTAMSSRERWTVYPLLFLTLGIALKDKITGQIGTSHVESKSVIANRVSCQSLSVTDNQGKPRVIVSPTEEGGIIQTVSARGNVNVSLGQSNSQVGVFFTDPDGRLLPTRTFLRLTPSRSPQQELENDGTSRPQGDESSGHSPISPDERQ
jgi:hypothetical protein